MTNEESAALINDLVFRGRVKVACLRYADSILANPGGQPAPNATMRWAMQTFQQPDMIAQQIQGPTVMDGAVQSAGANVTDQALQGAVETQVRRML